MILSNWKKNSLYLILLTLFSFTIHKFYIGTADLEYVKAKKTFRLTTRIFIDDLEKVLKNKYQKNIYLTDKAEIPEANQYVGDYIKEKFKLKVNKQELQLKFLGKEAEDNVLICYLNAEFSKIPKDIEITNNILMEAFSEQQNLVHLKVLENKETLLFNQNKTNHKVKIN